MDRMRRGQPGRLEAQPRKERVGFDQPFERRRHHLHLHGPQRRRPIFQKRAIAKLRQGQGGPRGSSAAHVLDVAVRTGFRLEPGGERIAHAGDQQPRRSLGDHGGIDQHQVGVLAVDAVFVKDALGRVDHGQRTARRIARGHGRAANNRQAHVGCRGPRGVKNLTASGADDDPSLLLPRRRLDPLDFRQAAFAAKAMDPVSKFRFTQALSPALGEELECRLPRDNQRRPLQPETDHFSAQRLGRVLALGVPTWGREYSEHDLS